MANKKSNLKLILSCLTLVLFVGCAKKDSTQLTDNNVIKQVSEEDVYKIAVAAPQFGPYEELGLSIVRGAQLAVELKNKNGGINGKQIKLINVDDGGLSGDAIWRAKSLVQEKVLGVIGHLNSDISIPASEIYSKAMIAEISPGSTSPLFTERTDVKGYVFRTIGRDDTQGEIAAEFALEKKNFKKIAVLYNDRSYGHSLSSEFKKHIENKTNSPEVVFFMSYKVDTQDFSSEVATLKQTPPEFIFFAGEYGDAARFLKQLRASGLQSVFLGSEGVFDEKFIETGKTSTNGALVISLPEVKDKDFIQKYKEKFGKEIGSYSANSFDATNVLLSAIEKAKSKDSEKVAKELRNIMDFSGLTGKISFDEKGDLVNPQFSIYEVKGKSFAVFKS